MSNGFIVFTCEEPDLLEVWRWAEDQAREPCDRAPSSQQIAMYEVRATVSAVVDVVGYTLGLGLSMPSETRTTGLDLTRVAATLYLWAS